jgi:cytochrome c553
MNHHAQLITTILITTLLLGSVAAHAAGDPDAGREKAKGCASCHGVDGHGRIPLAGDSAGYLEEQLRAYRSRIRRDDTMNAIAKGLGDQDIADLAAYFAAQ